MVAVHHLGFSNFQSFGSHAVELRGPICLTVRIFHQYWLFTPLGMQQPGNDIVWKRNCIKSVPCLRHWTPANFGVTKRKDKFTRDSARMIFYQVDVPWGDFLNFGMWGQVPDVIMHAKFYVNRFSGFGVLTPPNPSIWSLLQQCKHCFHFSDYNICMQRAAIIAGFPTCSSTPLQLHAINWAWNHGIMRDYDSWRWQRHVATCYKC